MLSIPRGVEPALKCGQPTRCNSIQGNWGSNSQKPSHANRSSASGRASCPPPSWDLVWVEFAQVTAAVSPYYNFPVTPIKQSPCRNPPCWALTIFLALSCEVSESFREGHDMCVPFKTKHSITSFLLLVDHTEIWLPTSWKGKLFWTGVDRGTDLPV